MLGSDFFNTKKLEIFKRIAEAGEGGISHANVAKSANIAKGLASYYLKKLIADGDVEKFKVDKRGRFERHTVYDRTFFRATPKGVESIQEIIVQLKELVDCFKREVA